MSSPDHAPNASEYIVHHLAHLNTKAQGSIIDLSVVNIDTLFWSLMMGFLGCFFMWRAATHATAGVPGRFQALVEMLVEMVNDQAKAIIHSAESRQFVAPLAMMWVTPSASRRKVSLRIGWGRLSLRIASRPAALISRSVANGLPVKPSSKKRSLSSRWIISRAGVPAARW